MFVSTKVSDGDDEDNVLVVAEVTVVDDSRVEPLGVRLYDLKDLFRDQAGGLAVLWVD